MESIRPLPENLRSAVRSGIVLFDLTRVVEELVFNSLDARATKVSVFVSIGSCYIKVVDDGGGITRDGLELVGERYATSKFLNLADMNAASGNFGFRGEALASISEVSLLEIVTRTYGRPNGYRKILKGCKCLYLGIDDDRKDVGTTVVVRDVFYNQPVRRKYMQSSPNKVLQSIKKCVMRLALVCPNISFKVVDIEREDEIFCTHSGSSPLSLVTSGFGVEVTCSLRELEVENDIIKLSGYMSGPCNTLNMKALQYVYVNSQFICKGPIHKLLSQLAVRFEHLNSCSIDKEFKNRKRSRSQPCPAYILNLRCPRSLYDLTYEPSKTYVNFKDWAPILKFIEKAIKKFWEGAITCGESSNQATNILQEDQPGKTDLNIISAESDIIDAEDISKFRNQNCKDHLDIFSPSSDKLTEDECHQFNRADVRTSLGYLRQGISMFEEQQRNYFLDSKYPSAESFYDNVSSSSHGRKFHKVDADPISESFEGHLLYECDRFNFDMELNGDFQKPFLKSCSTQEANILNKKALFVTDERERPTDSFWSKQNLGENYGCDEDSCARPCLEVGNKWKISKHSDFLLREFDEENCVPPYTCSLATQIGRSGSDDRLLNSELYSICHEPSSQPTALGVYLTTDINDLGGESRYYRSVHQTEILDDKENECNFSYNMSKNVNQNHFTSSIANSGLDFDGAIDCYEISDRSVDLLDFDDVYSIKKSDILDEDPNWLLPESCIKNCHRHDKDEGKRDHSRHPTLENRDRSRRGFSAPPFPRSKRRFFSLNHPSEMMAIRPSVQVSSAAFKHREASEFKYPQQSSDDPYEGSEDLLLDEFKTNVKQSSEVPGETQDVNKTAIHKFEIFNIQNSDPFRELISKEVQDSKDYGTKWRNCSPQTPVMKNDKLVGIQSQHSILDISSGFLHLAGDALIPKTINKKCLEDAVVLHQVDKKFIPVVAGRTLAIIDQHAADERIRLEDLRQKVLSGEAKAITYLDAEQELVLPEIGYQLLHSYSKQIKDWGWICNIHDQNSESFRRNLDILNRQQMPVTLIAVPCILGVNLNDVDLLEFLQQLADTDGSSTIPPSVIRVLNLKACRGAIMFGDSLLPSECSLLVEELKHTSLCFQCAHGRPTTVPLVNLEALHNQIAKLGLTNESDKWHGFHRHKISVERAEQRLSSAMGS